jgi:bacterioferritin
MPVANQDAISQLNAVLRNKLTAINQYFLHARVLKHLGHLALADQEYKASLVAMKHSDMLVEHVLSLGGLPNMQELGTLRIGETPEAILHNDLTHAEDSLRNVKEAMAICETAANLATVGLLKKIQESHQERIEFIHAQLADANKNTALLKKAN